MKRLSWHNERAGIQKENATLASEIERLEKEIDRGLSDETVEKIAREHYGMRREGETVYPVEKD
jgi:cell division protein FtsB